MMLRRYAGKLGLMVLVVSSMGAVPVGSCARACGAGGRAASRGARGGSELARLGRGAARSGDELARLGRGAARSGDDVARLGGRARGLAPVGIAPAGGLGLGDDLAHLSAARLDHAVAALPEVEGAASRLASVPSPAGARVVEGRAGRSFGRDYARSIDQVGLSRGQHQDLVDALDVVQDLAVEAIGQLVDSGESGDFDAVDVDVDDVAPVRVDELRAPDEVAPSPAVTAGARRRLQAAGRVLDQHLERILDPDQRARLHAALGSSEVIAYRLGRDRPIADARPRPRRTPPPAR